MRAFDPMAELFDEVTSQLMMRTFHLCFHTYSAKLEGALWFIRTEFTDQVIVNNVDATGLEDRDVVIPGVDLGRYINRTIGDQIGYQSANVVLECGVKAFM